MVDSAGQTLREFVYLDEASVQSLLVSLIGTLPSEITSLSARSTEAETSGTISGGAPLIAKAELAARFQGSSSNSNQVLSRAVAESLFKNFYELVQERLVWSPSVDHHGPVALERGSLIEVNVELAPDPIYGFSATMGVLTDIAEDYPRFAESNSTTSLVLAEAGPVNKVLERLLVGLIPLKSPAVDLRAGIVDGSLVAGSKEYFDTSAGSSEPIAVVGVTDQNKYWRDVRRVLFSKSRFTILGRIARSGVQSSWTPVKLTEVMRDIAPEFPEAISRVGAAGYSSPANSREEGNRDALTRALVLFALATGAESARLREAEIEVYAQGLRGLADDMASQRQAFDQMSQWLVDSEIMAAPPENARALRSEARMNAGLRSNSDATSLADFVSKDSPAATPDESLIDLEVIAIYW